MRYEVIEWDGLACWWIWNCPTRKIAREARQVGFDIFKRLSRIYDRKLKKFIN